VSGFLGSLRFDSIEDTTAAGRSGRLIELPVAPEQRRKIIWCYYSHDQIPVGGVAAIRFYGADGQLIDEIPAMIRQSSVSKLGFAGSSMWLNAQSTSALTLVWDNSDGQSGYRLFPLFFNNAAALVTLEQNFDSAGTLRCMLAAKFDPI